MGMAADMEASKTSQLEYLIVPFAFTTPDPWVWRFKAKAFVIDLWLSICMDVLVIYMYIRIGE